ncbi:F-box/kelch-repeat protein SKIP25 [Mercurialis annua]|uniref:F-box/kelch-repeat protein SKIP25 n=1 Tax=Mercurialis annua TaxID=3986 RepID=UPI00215E89EB|nr:F-box/kelch-repeat protein SKIP25 [Mercurialis annua]
MANPIQQSETASTNTAKRQRLSGHLHNHRQKAEHQQTDDNTVDLLPGLPNHIAQICLSLVNPSLLFSVCHSWRRLIYSPSFPPFLSLYTILSSTDNNLIKFFSFDPISSSWELLPPPPADPPLRLILRHPSFISRRFPVQSVSVAGRLVLLAATTDNFSPALSRPLIFEPLSRKWTFGPPLTAPRRWCAAGTVNNNTVYVASGVGSEFFDDVAKSVEKWEKVEGLKGKWEKVEGLKDGKFSRDAIDAVGWRGKLCMVNMKGDTAKEGIIYDSEENMWQDMPDGMLAGWKGPVTAMNEETMYVVDEVKGALRKYDPVRDDWQNVIESDNLKGAQQIGSGGGRVCVICGGGIVVVDVAAEPVKLWVVDPPNGFEAVTVHILPRMSKSEINFPVSL